MFPASPSPLGQLVVRAQETTATPAAAGQKAAAGKLAMARSLGRADGERILAAIRRPRLTGSPVAHTCARCARTSPFGTLAYESIATTSHCITCRNTSAA